MFTVSRLSYFLAVVAWLAALTGCGGKSQSRRTREPQRLAPGQIAVAPNGIAFPAKYKNWPVLAIRERQDQNTISVVVGNLEATRAARNGQTNPWPDGSIIGHLVFDNANVDGAGNARKSGDFVRAEFMIKDVELYANNRSGWGWARWDGESLEPFGEQGFDEECIACHTEVSGNDWLFSQPVALP